uniref:Uncharacterized protein n=1 Tax=Oryza sativa subsp. japonica TaxID=39947 RepID=Q8S654_ORYSJ|nr:Hypothetical protein [Oryza sativa Japonica Group]
MPPSPVPRARTRFSPEEWERQELQQHPKERAAPADVVIAGPKAGFSPEFRLIPKETPARSAAATVKSLRRAATAPAPRRRRTVKEELDPPTRSNAIHAVGLDGERVREKNGSPLPHTSLTDVAIFVGKGTVAGGRSLGWSPSENRCSSLTVQSVDSAAIPLPAHPPRHADDTLRHSAPQWCTETSTVARRSRPRSGGGDRILQRERGQTHNTQAKPPPGRTPTPRRRRRRCKALARPGKRVEALVSHPSLGSAITSRCHHHHSKAPPPPLIPAASCLPATSAVDANAAAAQPSAWATRRRRLLRAALVPPLVLAQIRPRGRIQARRRSSVAAPPPTTVVAPPAVTASTTAQPRRRRVPPRQIRPGGTDLGNFRRPGQSPSTLSMARR